MAGTINGLIMLLIILNLFCSVQKTSQQLKRLVMVQYASLFIGLFPVGLIQYERLHSESYNTAQSKFKEDPAFRVFVYRWWFMFFLFIRIYNEPIMWKGIFTNPVSFVLRRKNTQLDQKLHRFEDNTLCSFINQASNIEMVVLILSGIKQTLLNSFMPNEDKQIAIKPYQYSHASKWEVDNQLTESEATGQQSQVSGTVQLIDFKYSKKDAANSINSRSQVSLPEKDVRSLTQSITRDRLNTDSCQQEQIGQNIDMTKQKGLQRKQTEFKIEETSPFFLDNEIEKYKRITMKAPPSKYIQRTYITRLSQATIKSHYEEQFQQLLFVDNIEIESIIESLDIESNRQAVFKAGESAGASGSFFFFSHDSRFIIKSMNSDDKYKLQELMESDYCQYLSAFPDSFLARIYGMFTVVRNDSFKKTDVIIMENTCFLQNKVNKVFAFDLKGSTVGREAKVSNLDQKVKDWKFPELMKDVNFLDINNYVWENKLVNVNSDSKNKILKTMKRDSEFLSKHNIMDYSLLLVGEKIDSLSSQINPNRNQFVSSDGQYLYHLGLIDYLQDWNLNKKSEHWAKRIFKGKNGKLISAIEPKTYGHRFRDFIQTSVLVESSKTKHEWLKDIKL